MQSSGVARRENARVRLSPASVLGAKRRFVRRRSASEGGSNPEFLRGDSLDCFGTYAPRDGDEPSAPTVDLLVA